MPEGLQMYACVLADILESFAGVEAVVMGDVAYGACCVDDYSAAALGADFLVHYGHRRALSALCLVPVDVTPIPCMYVFVDIKMDVEHFIATVRHNFPAGSRLVLAGTIQALTKEGYDQEGMRAARRAAIEAARGAEGCWGLVLGTLGRQGNLGTLARLRALLDAAGRPHIMVLLSEVTPAKLAALGEGGIDAWVQAYVALGAAPGWWEPGAGGYAMDYYASQGGAWNGTYHRAQPRAGARPSPAAVAAAARAAAGVAGAAAAAGPGGSAAVAVDGT
eukprot:scaffold12.g8026.t1